MDISTRAEALFASPLRPCDRPSSAQVEAAIASALQNLGVTGCVRVMAQEFGDHPDTAVARMRWALGFVRPVHTRCA